MRQIVEETPQERTKFPKPVRPSGVVDIRDTYRSEFILHLFRNTSAMPSVISLIIIQILKGFIIILAVNVSIKTCR